MMTDRDSAGSAFATPELEDDHDLDVLAERYQRARDAVIQSEARYRNLFETAIDAIYTVDLDGSFTSVNEATATLTGLPKTELLGRSSRMLFDGDELALVKEEFRHSLAGDAVRFECRLRRADGESRLLSVTNTPIRAGRNVVGVLGVARDVTVERERAAALERAEARYLQLMEVIMLGVTDDKRAVAELLNGVAHELNDSLAGVLSNAERFLAGAISSDSEARAAVEAIRHGATRATRIASRLSALAQRQAAVTN
jgi:PAS domain S-box-containing protein